ncbi:IS1182 family transposase [Blastopirellula sp. J2-11]|nr:IS1182 family transposase [Blastopirellula sp. J2-11]UUO08205.1 IS1182 family transposase [Blastopirellula sp. J2-11]
MVRVQQAQRQQVEWRPLALDELLTDDHSARLVWAYVDGLDLAAFYEPIAAVEGGVGRNPIDPKILLALWLQATIDGIGSARRLDRMCREHLTYLWMCGGVTVNYHTLADFRVRHADRLDQLLTQSVATLLHQELIDLNRVAQDGMRVRASAGSSSFRRKPTLEKCLQEAEEQLKVLREERESDDVSAEDRRVKGARERAARERAERVQAALEEREKIVPKMERRKKGSGDEARASTTDPEARKMKMGDGGFRPAYNVQFATTTETRVIVGLDVVNAGTDGGQLQPMYEQLIERYSQRPEEYLADAGFSNLEAITHLEANGTNVYLPITDEEKKRSQGRDPHAPMPGDSQEVEAWRARMGTDEAKEIYKERASSAEFSNATCRNRGLNQFNVRSLAKAKAVALWHALAHNFQRLLALTRQRSTMAT